MVFFAFLLETFGAEEEKESQDGERERGGERERKGKFRSSSFPSSSPHTHTLTHSLTSGIILLQGVFSISLGGFCCRETHFSIMLTRTLTIS